MVAPQLVVEAQDVPVGGALGASHELAELRLKMGQLLNHQLRGHSGASGRQSDFVDRLEVEPVGEADSNQVSEFIHTTAAASGNEGKDSALHQLLREKSSNRPASAAAAAAAALQSEFSDSNGRENGQNGKNSTVGFALMGSTDRLRDSLLSKIRARNHSSTNLDALVKKLEKSQASWDSGKVSYCWNAALAVHKKCGGKGVVSFNDLSTKAECERKAIEGRKKSYAWVDTTKRCQVFNACTRFKSSGQPWKIFDRCSF